MTTRYDDAMREDGYYFAELPWGKTIVAYWGVCGGGRPAWWLAGHPDAHETEYFRSIGDPILLKGTEEQAVAPFLEKLKG